ncbi:hypothetical protein AGRA3207_000987 [Actinomadura graeca]|uniref:Lipoprotein n=1 Tax=Actinomadura graeca TaxID=2750812 RepID=A0ABX8QNW7_9ACTN|nr:hypothetical protein [Actinomadura graeca]QXJ20298.1 hypothetical protein AGRA3207_000987 [Actinomadura graeca]
MSSRPSRRRAPLVVAALVLATGGCASGGAPGAAPASQSPPAAPGDFALPVNAYLPTVTETGRLTRARTLLLRKCVSGFGLAVGSDDGSVERAARAEIADHGVYGNKRRYGVTVLSDAVRNGYRLPSAVGGTAAPGHGGDRHPWLGELTPVKISVLYGRGTGGGPAPVVNGRPVPQGGCTAQITARLARAGGPPSFQQAELPSRIKAESFTYSLAHPRLIAAFRAWSRCMRSRGHEVTHPLDAGKGTGDDGRTVPPAEIALARDDVGCKQRVRLVKTWFDIEAAFQRERIRAHHRELESIRSANRNRMKAVADIIRTGA